MIGLGTIINTAAIVIGGLMGILFGKKIPDRLQDTLMKANGICVIFIGIAGTLQEMLTITPEGRLESGGTMMMIGCIIIGSVIGEIINIEHHLEGFGEWLKRKTKVTRIHPSLTALLQHHLRYALVQWQL